MNEKAKKITNTTIALSALGIGSVIEWIVKSFLQDKNSVIGEKAGKLLENLFISISGSAAATELDRLKINFT